MSKDSIPLDEARVHCDELLELSNKNAFVAEDWRARFYAAQAEIEILRNTSSNDLVKARLDIAELLEALKTCRSVIDQLMGDTDPHEETSALVACQRASAAIAKAEGLEQQ